MTRARFPRFARAGTMFLTVIIGVGLVGSVSGPTPAAAATKDPQLAQKLAAVMRDPRVTHATSATVVLDQTTGIELYSRYGSRPTTPASNTKILTAVSAMHTLGPSFRFKTEVIRRGEVRNGVLLGNLYLKGYGDPTTMESDLRSLARQVAASGIRRVSQQVVADASYFDSQRYNPNWSTAYASDYYAAQISALTVAPSTDYDSGTVILNYRPGEQGKKAVVTVTPAAAAKYVTINNWTTTSSKGTSSSFYAHRTLRTNTITLSGRVPLGRSTAKHWITVSRPELLAAAVFRGELAKLKITVAGGNKIMTIPQGKQKIIATDRSMMLSELLVPFMKLSNNMHAEALTKTMGTLKGRAGNWTDGLSFTLAYVKRLGAPMNGITLVDGSGLTRANKITPRAMARVLFTVQAEAWFPAFDASLPVAGNAQRMVGGTLSRRMNATSAANNAHAKTGTLSGVTALSGYVRGADGRRYVFSMLSQYNASTPRPVENTLVITLANHRR